MGTVATTGYIENRFKSGTYIGNGTTQDIELGFRPPAVKIESEDGKITISKRDGGPTKGKGQAVTASSVNRRAFTVSEGNGLVITDIGFTIDGDVLNQNGIVYDWRVL